MILLLALLTIALATGLGLALRRLASTREHARLLTEFGRPFFYGAPEALLILEPDGRIARANPAAESLFTRSDLEGVALIDLVSEADRDRVASMLEWVAENGDADFECRTDAGVGSDLRVRIHAVEIDGVRRLLTILHDISEHRHIERALEQSVSLLRATLEATADGILVTDLDGRIVSANRRFFEMWAIPETLLETGDDRLILYYGMQQLKDPDAYVAHVKRLMKDHDHEGFDILEFEDGRVFERYVRPQRRGMEVIGRVWSFRDVTEQKRGEERLRTSERRIRSLIENISDTVAILNPDGTIRYSIQATDAGVSALWAELLGDDPAQLVHEEDLPRVRAILADIVARPGSGTRIEFRHRAFGGEWRTWDLIVRNLREDPIVGGIVVNAHDVTERKRTEDELRVQRAYFAELFESSPEAIVLLDENDRVLQANGEFTRMFGYTLDEAIGRPINELIAPADLRDEALAYTVNVARGNKVNVEAVRVRKDGTPIHVSILGTPIKIPGEPTRVYGIYRDITQRVQLEEKFRQAQKMEAVGRLAGGVAHDFNNLLTAISGHAQILLEDLPADDPARADIEEISRAADRAADLTRQLLAFSRKQMLRSQVLDPNALIGEIQKMLRRLIGEDIELITRLAPDLGAVRADPGQLEQVIMNLAVNARDAMPTGGRLLIETRNVELGEDDARRLAPLQPGPHVVLIISDTGAGMDESTRERIFEPFFTTKEKGKGTGLGLSTVYGIVQQSGGHIWVYSEPGQGTTFKIYLPRVDARPEAAPAPSDADGAHNGREVVLLVEDEDAVRSLARRILEKRGYTVLTARTGPEALRIAERHDGPIHLILTDVVMPEMSGRELAERIAPTRPDARTLFMSGYTEDDVLRRGVLNEGAAFLEKPFTPSALAQKVREVLDG